MTIFVETKKDMIIAINGNLIDTKNIFKITPVPKEREWDDDGSRIDSF
jgi:hypothetical protein